MEESTEPTTGGPLLASCHPCGSQGLGCGEEVGSSNRHSSSSPSGGGPVVPFLAAAQWPGQLLCFGLCVVGSQEYVAFSWAGLRRACSCCVVLCCAYGIQPSLEETVPLMHQRVSLVTMLDGGGGSWSGGILACSFFI